MIRDFLPLKPGEVVEKLRIDRVLGQGAFGITYLVTDEVLGKTFALKEYVPRDHVHRRDTGTLEPSSPASTDRFAAGLEHFLQEGRTVAPLDHPNIVTVFRCFEANGTAYLLMPYYRGEALHKLLKRSGTLSADEAHALAIPLLQALEYIHQRDVIHQDIKPANIYITENGEPILLDFGAAGQRLEANSSLRWRLGSEGYAAAEQSRPDGKVGPWTDIYALAATLYRSISGQVPIAASQREQSLEAGEGDPLTPIDKLVAGPEFDALRQAITLGMAVSADERLQNVSEWRRHFIAGASTRPGKPGSPLADVETEGREWLPITLLAVVLLALIAGAVYLFTGDEPRPDEPVEEVTEQSGEADRSGAADLPPTEEKRRWQEALESDTAFGYQLFMQDFPDSLYNAQAQEQLNALDERAWENARVEGTRSAIEAHLEQFPGGLHETEAKIILNEFDAADAEAERLQQERDRQDDQAWAAARTRRTLEAIDQYIGQWPDGRHLEEARDLRGEVAGEVNDLRAFEAAKKLNTVVAYQAYVDAFPRGRRVAEALEQIDTLTLRPGKTFRDCSECPSMIVVPAGSYWQGAEEDSEWALNMEKPRRMVTFSEPFAVGVFEVTLQQWDSCVAEGGCSTRPRDNGWGRDKRPVIMVSWNDAQEYVTWLNRKTGQTYRLPSESEWEYFARAGEEGEWIGGAPSETCLYGNVAGQETGLRWQHEACADVAATQTLPVGSLKPNGFGIYDVIGNVAEWTLDCMNLSYLDAPADGSAWGRGICSSRMTRGGSWFTGSKEIRLPSRFNLKTGDRNDFTGFRVVRELED